MARSRNYQRRHCERQKVIVRREIKTKHRPAAWDKHITVSKLDLSETVALMRSGELGKKELRFGWQQHLWTYYRRLSCERQSYERQTFFALLRKLDRQGYDLQREESLTILWHMATYAKQMIRSYQDWKPKPGSSRCITGLLRIVAHCFALYEVPPFLHRVWTYRSKARHREWYLALGRGESIRALSDLPMPINKKMAHHLRIAPGHLRVDQAFRWAQVRSLGGDEVLAQSILNTVLGRYQFGYQEYYEEVIRWMTRQEVILHQVNEIIDFLNGMMIRREPLSLSGRTWRSVHRLSEVWHAQFRRPYYGGYVANLDWQSQGLQPWEIDMKYSETTMRYRVVELCTSELLKKESMHMKHCVVTYSHRCHSRQCAIFSVRQVVNGVELAQPTATLELLPSRRKIVQARSVANQMPDDITMEVIARWAQQHALEFTGG